ncbi:MAG: hypothetical protein HY000_37660 [Planctomycetes bacterium]|nr:hypothetical protein [Planctomycetota bacterium]
MAEHPDQLYDSLMSFQVADYVSTTEALQRVAALIDLAGDLGRPQAVDHGINLATQFLERSGLDAGAKATTHYFLANAWSHKGRLSRITSGREWDWKQEEVEKEFIHLRLAMQEANSADLPAVRRCQIQTNFANLLSFVGRFVEAIEYWNRALNIDAAFSMAMANRGYGLSHYGRVLYDPGHTRVFLQQAYRDLAHAVSLGVDDSAAPVFERCRAEIEAALPIEWLQQATEMERFSLGESTEERSYRRFCLDAQLFLNPLNDLGAFPIAAHDCFTTPSIVVDVGEGPYYHGFFNQLKQEFVSARYLYYDGITAAAPHFADKGVLLYDTMDYPSYSLAVEKQKAAFRIGYSLFDKVAYFLNHYLRLGIPERSVTFRTIWYEKQDRAKGLKSQLQGSQNWPLRGLFWLSKDVFENNPGTQDSIEPDARELDEIRNHLEHKYLKLHGDEWSPALEGSRASLGIADTLAHSLSRRDFEARTLRILKLARAALIYLSLGVYSEERQRRKATGKGKRVVRAYLNACDDASKL